MFDASGTAAPTGPVRPLDVATIATWVTALAETGRSVDDAERIDQIRVLEELKAAASAAQARATADLDDSFRRRHAEARIPMARHGQGVAAQVARASREPSPWGSAPRPRESAVERDAAHAQSHD